MVTADSYNFPSVIDYAINGNLYWRVDDGHMLWHPHIPIVIAFLDSAQY
jgi:hypothetical protein